MAEKQLRNTLSTMHRFTVVRDLTDILSSLNLNGIPTAT